MTIPQIILVAVGWVALSATPFLLIYAARQRQEHARIKNATGSSTDRDRLTNHGERIQ